MSFRKVSEELLQRGQFLEFCKGIFEDASGHRFERDLVHHPGAVVILPLTTEDKVIMVRQYRAAADREVLELPAGKRDVDGEPTEVTAARELEEEVGRQAGHLELLSTFYNSPGFCDELTWLYLATDLTQVPDSRQGVEEQEMTVEEVPLAEVLGMIRSGQLNDAKTIVGLSVLLATRASEGDQQRA